MHWSCYGFCCVALELEIGIALRAWFGDPVAAAETYIWVQEWFAFHGCTMEDEDMSHDGAPETTLPQELMEEYDQEDDAGGSQGALAPPPPDDARAGFEQRRARSSHGARFRERGDSMNQRMADANFFNRFDDDFDEDDMKLPSKRP